MDTLKANITIISFSLLLNAVSSGAVISAWDVEGVDLDASGSSGIDGNSTSSPYSFSAGTIDTHLQSARLTLSSSVNPTTTIGQYGFKISGVDEQTTLDGAIAEGHFLQFELVAAPGYQIDLSSLEIFGQSSGSGADNVALFSSVDGFTSSGAIASLGNISGDTGGFDTDSSGFGAPIDLSSSVFQGLSDITFRIYGWNTTSGSGITYLRSLSGNDLIVNGTVSAIPELTTFFPAGALIGFGLFRRRRNATA